MAELKSKGKNNSMTESKANYRGSAYTPKGVQAMNKGKTKSSDMAPKKFGQPKGGEMYKKPMDSRVLGKHRDESSGESLPRKCGDDNKKRYSGHEQPVQYSNAVGPRLTKFVS